MAGEAAHLEIGFRWREDAGTFDATIEYDDPEDRGDQRDFARTPIRIDTEKLRTLEPGEYGRRLTEMALGPIEQFYTNARRVWQGPDTPLHLRLFIDPSAPPRFHEVHWERLLDGPNGEPLATMPGVYLSRFLGGADWRRINQPPKHDLRVVVAVASPSDIDRHDAADGSGALAHVDAKAEIARVMPAMHGSGMQVTTLGREHRTTLSTLAEYLGEWEADVLYLVCHGAIGKDGRSRLFLEDDAGVTHAVRGDKFVRMVEGLRHRPTVIALCACGSAGAGDRTVDGGALAAVGPELARAGIAAVVAMQGNVTMETARTFFPEFFRELSRHGVVDRAVAAARAEVSTQGDWWVPVLFTRLKRGRTHYIPGFASGGQAKWRSVRRNIAEGYGTAVVGPGIADDILGSRHEIARSWADLWQMPIPASSRDDFVTVAQYLRVRIATLAPEDELRRYLARTFEERYRTLVPDGATDKLRPEELARRIGAERRKDADDPYVSLASIGFPVYVTTSWTSLLEDALTDAKRPPTVRCFEWWPLRDEHPRERLAAPTPEAPLVYHLFGRLDLPDSLVLSEDDYFRWLAAWNRARSAILPGEVGTALTRRSLLFVGYRLDDWDFRVLFHSIKRFGNGDLGGRPHAGVQIDPEMSTIDPESAKLYLESYFGVDNLSIYFGEPRKFLADLRDEVREHVSGAPG